MKADADADSILYEPVSKRVFVFNGDPHSARSSIPRPAPRRRPSRRVDSNTFDAATGMIACATGDDAIHIFHEDSPGKYCVVETVTTEYCAKTMALDPKTHNLLVDTSDFEAPAAGTTQRRTKRRTFRLLILGR